MKYQALKTSLLKRNFRVTHNTKSGCSGYYFLVTPKIGVKVYFGGGHKRPWMIRHTHTYWYAARTLNTMRRVYSVGVSPKPYFIAPVKVDGLYYVGLVMEHVSGKKAYPFIKVARAHKKLQRMGLILCDRGAHNTIVKKDGSVVLIDFDGFEWKNNE